MRFLDKTLFTLSLSLFPSDVNLMKMSSLKSWYSALAVISFTGWCTADLARKPLDRPNILLFLADDMGYVRDGLSSINFFKVLLLWIK